MKNILSLLLLFVVVHTTAQNITVTDTIVKFGVTATGKPDGQKNNIKIGKDGGTIQSSDGKVELIFPAGAVNKKTKISIQPVTNFALNSSGKAYQMEPSGITFEQPVQIIFHYRDDDTEGGLPNLLGIAMQDDKGLWSPLKNVVVDTLLKTTTAYIQHFSLYVNYLKAKINPSSAKVKVNGSLRLQITNVKDMEDDYDDGITWLSANHSDQKVLWSVNGIPKGNNNVGLISISQNYSAIFKAPAQVPEQNPVAVTVEDKFKKYHFLLTSNILIYGDAWEVNMEASIKGGSESNWGGYSTNSDNGSFVVSLENNKAVVKNIKNNLETLTDNCSKTILNPTTCTGIIHVAGSKFIKVTPANPPGEPNPIVEIIFIKYPVILTQAKYNCPPPPGFKGGPAIGTINNMTTLVFQMIARTPAIPQYLKFEAKEGEQVLMEEGSPGSESYFKIWVKKIKDK